MTATELFQEGVNLMMAGMGFVLVFLLLLIWALGLTSILINRFFPDPVSKQPKAQPIQSSQPDDLERLRPVIVAAIAHYRRSQGLN